MRPSDWALRAAASAILLAAPWPAKAQRFHDARLEKATAELLAEHKAADVSGAMRKAMDQQAVLDSQEIDRIRQASAADQEQALSELLSADPEYLGLSQLRLRVNSRIDKLIGPGVSFNAKDWAHRASIIASTKARVAEQEQTLKLSVNAYRQGGGTDFVDCARFKGAHAGDPAGSTSRSVIIQCDLVEKAGTPLEPITAAVASLDAGSGLVSEVAKRRKAATTEVETQEAARNDAKSKLDEAKKALEDAKKSPNANARVAEKLEALDALLTKLDGEAGLVGQNRLAPGAALALIEFRKTNLREVLGATGSTDDTPAAQFNRSAAGIIAGIIRYKEAGKAPSPAALSVALTYQTGLEAVISARLSSFKAEAVLLGAEHEAALRELEYLALAQQALAGADDATLCGKRPLSQIPLSGFMLDEACPRAARQSIARALSAYSMSWASGRTPGQIANAQSAQERYMRKIRVADQIVRTRYDVQDVALQELAVYGASGVKPSDVASLLQAIGVQAIAIGVN